jgi:hypothetical protein
MSAGSAAGQAGIRWLGLFLRPHVERRMLLATPMADLAVAGLAIAFAAGSGKGSSEVLFSGQSALGPFITHSASYTVGALLLLLVCKQVMPLAIVAVVVAYVASARLTPPRPSTGPSRRGCRARPV